MYYKYYKIKLNKRPLVATSHYEDFVERTEYTVAKVINLSNFRYTYSPYEMRSYITGQTGIDIEPLVHAPLWHVRELHKDKLAKGENVHAVTMDMRENDGVPVAALIIDAVVEKEVVRADNLFMVRLPICGRYIYTGICWGNIVHTTTCPLSYGLVEPSVNSKTVRDERAEARVYVARHFAEREVF